MSPPTGSAFIFGRAILEHPRRGGEDGLGGTRVLIFDAIFTGAEVVNESDEYCSSLAYVLNPDRPNVLAGVYDIYAKVVTFRHDVHMSSPARTTNDFDLMGLILEAIPVPGLDTHLTAIQFPARATVSGSVCAVQQDISAFTLVLHQKAEGASPQGSLKVRGLMAMTASPYLPCGVQTLPRPGAILTMSGQIAVYQFGVLVILVDTVSDLR